MNAFQYQAALLCPTCAKAATQYRARLSFKRIDFAWVAGHRTLGLSLNSHASILYIFPDGERAILSHNRATPTDPATVIVNLSDVHSDPDELPQGPWPCGGGEADTYQHCDHCHAYLNNPLTPDGVDYTLEALHRMMDTGQGTLEVLHAWASGLRNYDTDKEVYDTLERWDDYLGYLHAADAHSKEGA